MNTSTRGTVRNDNQDAPRGRLSSETRLAERSIDDEVDAVFASLSYLLDGGDHAPEPAPPPAPEPTPLLTDSDFTNVDDGWLDPPGQPEVTARVMLNQHTLATLRPERIEVPDEARPSQRSEALRWRGRDVLSPLMASLAASTGAEPPSQRETPEITKLAARDKEPAPAAATPAPSHALALPPPLPMPLPRPRRRAPVPVAIVTGLPTAPKDIRVTSQPPAAPPLPAPPPRVVLAPSLARPAPAPAPARPRLQWSSQWTALVLGAALIVGLRGYGQVRQAPPAPQEAPVVAAPAPETAVVVATEPAPAPVAAPAPTAPAEPTVAAPVAAVPVAPAAPSPGPAMSRVVAPSPAALAAALRHMLPAPEPKAPSSAAERPAAPVPATRPAVIPSTGPVLLDDR